MNEQIQEAIELINRTIMIQEYRKVSAEAIGLIVTEFSTGIVTRYKDGTYINWYPDTDANQMLMVWDWMRTSGKRKILREIFENYLVFKDTLELATMKAFMEYTKNN